MDRVKLFVVIGVVVVVGVPASVVGQTGWPSGGPQPVVSYDQYGNPIASGAATITERAQTAFNETGTAMRDGVEAGIRAANDQLSRGTNEAWDYSRNAASQVNQQINNQTREFANTAGNSLRSAAGQAINTVSGSSNSNPFVNAAPAAAPASGSTRGGVSSPWPTASGAASPAPAFSTSAPPSGAAANSGTPSAPINPSWSSIGTDVAAPRMTVPPMPTTASPTGASSYGNEGSVLVRNNGVSTAPAPVSAPPLHSPLTDPGQPMPTAASSPSSNWLDGWNRNANTSTTNSGMANSNGATIRDMGRGAELVPLARGPEATADPRTTTVGRVGDGFGDSWSGAASGGATISAGTQPMNSPQAPAGPGPSLLPPGPGNSATINMAGQNLGAIPSGGMVSTAGNTMPNNGMPINSIPANTNFNGQPIGQQPGGGGMAGMGPGNPAGNSNNAVLNNGGGKNGRENLEIQKTASGAGNEQQPWMPLVASLIALSGSLAANMYLGASYLDARQKYQGLVRKTADTFRRVKAVAA
ncbi:MAG: hypothetical protein IT425_15220 [Pirellulales bacterium]|nr:hypothetical protein [Pirellulales bacterium]